MGGHGHKLGNVAGWFRRVFPGACFEYHFHEMRLVMVCFAAAEAFDADFDL